MTQTVRQGDSTKQSADAGLELDLPRQRNRKYWWRIALVVEVVAILAVWEILITDFQLIRLSFLPPPSDIWASLQQLVRSPSFADHLKFSLSNLVIGLLMAAGVGIPVGLLVGWFRLLQITVAPFIWSLYATPKIALAPMIILWLGLGSPSKIALVFLLSVFPILLNTIEGVETVSPSLIHAGRVFGASGFRLGRKVILPATVPFILVGLQRGIALGFIGEILGEFIGGNAGLGRLLQTATSHFKMDTALAIVVVIVIVANTGFLVLALLRRKVAPWHEAGVSRRW